MRSQQLNALLTAKWSNGHRLPLATMTPQQTKNISEALTAAYEMGIADQEYSFKHTGAPLSAHESGMTGFGVERLLSQANQEVIKLESVGSFILDNRIGSLNADGTPDLDGDLVHILDRSGEWDDQLNREDAETMDLILEKLYA